MAITADAASTNTIDLGATGTPLGGSAVNRDVGRGGDIPVAVNVTQTFNNLTSLAVQVQTSPDASTWTTIETGRTTAHLSNALDDRYYHLESLHGEDGARLAAESQTKTGS